MRRYKSRKIYSWTPDIAYIAGLIAADGCLLNNGRHINVTSKDIDLLESVRTLLSLTCDIRQKLNGFGGIGHYVQFSNVSLYDFLLNNGITPAKSKTIQSVGVPDGYYADFLRGYFDGDGTIYGYWDSRWRKSLMYYTGFTSASIPFLEWLREMNTRLARTSDGQVKPNTRASTLTYAKADSQKLFNFMYYDTNLPHLQRKQGKFIDFLRLDPYANKALLARVVKW